MALIFTFFGFISTLPHPTPTYSAYTCPLPPLFSFCLPPPPPKPIRLILFPLSHPNLFGLYSTCLVLCETPKPELSSGVFDTVTRWTTTLAFATSHVVAFQLSEKVQQRATPCCKHLLVILDKSGLGFLGTCRPAKRLISYRKIPRISKTKCGFGV